MVSNITVVGGSNAFGVIGFSWVAWSHRSMRKYSDVGGYGMPL